MVNPLVFQHRDRAFSTGSDWPADRLPVGFRASSEASVV